MRHSSILLTSVFCLLTSACSGGWFGGDDDDTPLPGKRISVLEHRESLKTDQTLASATVSLPGTETNSAWPLQQVAPLPNPAWAGGDDEDAFSVARGGSGEFRLTSTPVIADGILYTLGADGTVSARETGNPGNVLWEHRIISGTAPDDLLGLGIVIGTGEKEFIGGNIAYGSGAVFAATRRGDVLALDAKTGEVQWQRSVKLPVKSAPVVKDDRVFVVTSDNRLYALGSDTGETLWIHAGIAETTSMFGVPSPAVTENWVVVPYSSGEVHTLEARTGRVVWGDVLTSTIRRRPTSLTLSGNATPVISRGKVYATSYDGVITAFDLTTGSRLWTQDIGGLSAPWVAGDFLFLLTSNNQVVALRATDGKVKWTASLPTHTEGSSWNSKGKRISWSGPVMAGGMLLLTGSGGTMFALSPQTGEVMREYGIPDNVLLSPVVANGTVYVLSNDGRLAVIR